MFHGVFDGLNERQKEAVEAVRGPVCIMAGAGSGKTTTITRRIANQVFSKAFGTGQILAVTFTDKAAGEMAAQLKSLGVPGVRAKTFHAEALSQYRRFSEDQSEILPSKARVIHSLVKSLPKPYCFVALRDIATEIEWAKNNRISADRYLQAVDDHRPPIPADLMGRLYSSYEKRKGQARLIDFEDLLGRTIALLESDSDRLEMVRAKYQAFTVDEYQDVNLLQQKLLETWVGERTDLCVVGDDYQSIFGFTGASADHLLEFPRRFPECRVFELDVNYRSAPAVIDVANRLVPRMGGSGKNLRAATDQAGNVEFREFSLGSSETTWIVDQLGELHARGVRWEEIAVLYRINARSEELEEELSKAGVPYQVRDSSFLRRAAAREVMHRLRKLRTGEVATNIEKIARDVGYREVEEAEGEEATRQADLERLIHLAREYPAGNDIAGFIADLTSRFSSDEPGRGIQILTYHRAKGLEFEAVFLPRLEAKELPFSLAKSPSQLAEERRLLYVGITRARRFLFISWARNRLGERYGRKDPSPFLDEIRAITPSSRTPGKQSPVAQERSAVAPEDQDLFAALRKWRLDESRKRAVPAYVVFNDETLSQIAASRPKTFGELLAIPGVGPSKLESFGHHVLALVRNHVNDPAL